MTTPAHLKIDGREPNNPIPPDVKLRRHVGHVDVVGERAMLPVDELDYPGSDGMSVNRGDYATVMDCMELASNPLCGVVAWTAGQLRSESTLVQKPDGKGRPSDAHVNLDARHAPEPGSATVAENYAHSLIVTYMDGHEFDARKLQKSDKAWAKRIKEHFRLRLSVLPEIERFPLRS